MDDILTSIIPIGAEPSGWRRSTFRDLLKSGDILKIQDGNHGGYYPTAEDFAETGVPLVTGANMQHGTLSLNDCKYLKPEAADKLTKGKARSGDIILSHKGSVGKTAIISDTFEGEVILNPQLTLYRIKKDGIINPKFLKYFFDNRLFQEFFFRISAISTIPTFGLNAQKTIEIVFPCRKTQDEIVHLLSVLDDKIEMNRKTNETLEAIAQAIFRDWFLDFGPVRRKMAGASEPSAILGGLLPPNAPKATEIASLFPDRLADNGLPDGWEMGTLDNIAKQAGSTITPEEVPSATPYIGLEHMPRKCIALSDWETAEKVTSNKTRFKRGNILFGKLRPYFHKVGIAPIDGICSTDIVVLESKHLHYKEMVASLCSSSEFVAYTDQTSTGTKMPRTSWNIMKAYELSIPSEAAAKAFSSLVAPMHTLIASNIHMSKSLAETRDYLLPRLMNGQAEVHLPNV